MYSFISLYCTYNTDMSRPQLSMQFSLPTAPATTQTTAATSRNTSFQMGNPTTSRFRMYTAMNDILYSNPTGGCSSCGKKKEN